MTWSFSLVTPFIMLFYRFTGCYSKGRMQTSKYLFLTTKSLQAIAFQDLKKQAVLVYKTLADEAKRIKKLLSSH